MDAFFVNLTSTGSCESYQCYGSCNCEGDSGSFCDSARCDCDCCNCESSSAY